MFAKHVLFTKSASSLARALKTSWKHRHSACRTRSFTTRLNTTNFNFKTHQRRDEVESDTFLESTKYRAGIESTKPDEERLPHNLSAMLYGILPISATSSTNTVATSAALPTSIVTFLKFAPPVACQVVFLAPLATMKQFKADKSTNEVSPIPYAAMTVNGALWVMYGLLKSDFTIILPNISGFFFGAYYTYTFSLYTERNMIPYYAGVAAGIGFCATVATSLETAAAINAIGLFGCGIVATMFGGPLGSIKTVIEDENTDSLPVAFTLATFVNCTLWSSYGWFIIDDIYVWGPNLAGLVFSSVQIGLYGKYGLPRKKI